MIGKTNGIEKDICDEDSITSETNRDVWWGEDSTGDQIEKW